MTPEHFERIVGQEATFRVLARAHGQPIYIAKTVTEKMLELFGTKEAAQAIVNELGGNTIIVPAGRRYRIHALAKRGLSKADIAASMSMTRRGVNLALSDKNAA